MRLLDKVNKHGIGGIWSWIKEWLRDRKQRVCLSGHCSSWISVTSVTVVPQGSVLGPTLFLIFINDLESSLLSSLLKFADDTKVFCQITISQGSVLMCVGILNELTFGDCASEKKYENWSVFDEVMYRILCSRFYSDTVYILCWLC